MTGGTLTATDSAGEPRRGIAPSLAVDIQYGLRIPMRDGVTLAADCYRPRRAGRYPGVLFRTPYGRQGAQAAAQAARGYGVLAVDARGTGGSGGTYTYYNIRDGFHDGYDLVEWLAAQPFCTGAVGTTGGSAAGIYQILTAAAAPPHLACMCCSAYPLDFYRDQWYPGGVFRLESRAGWIAALRGRTGPDAVYPPPGPATDALSPADRELLDAIRIGRYRRLELAARRGEGPDGWATPYLTHPMRDETWDAIDLTPHMRRIQVPILHSSVYYDHFGAGTLRGHALHAGPKRLAIVPGMHGFQGEEQDIESLEPAWLDYWLKGIGRESDVLSPGVVAYTTGCERWLSFDAMPEPSMQAFGLRADGVLVPAPGEGTVELIADPERPAQTLEGDFARYSRQSQVVAFASAPVATRLHVFGRAELRLRLATGMADANLIGRIGAIAPDGRYRQLNYGARKLTLRKALDRPLPLPRNEPFEATVRFWPVSHVFEPGARLLVTLALSDSPAFEHAPCAGTVRVLLDACELAAPVLAG